jgi:hypothetical protein
MTGPDTVNYSDGEFTNNTDFTRIYPQLNPPLTSANIVQLYAAKHNPFVYFQNVQQGTNPMVSYAQMAAFDGAGGLWGDLASGKVPNFPTSCLTSATTSTAAATEPHSEAGLNPALIILGDQAVQKLVTAIHSSPAWHRGHAAIVVVWDENDYAVEPIYNQVVTIVDTNCGFHQLQSGEFYTHFSLLRSLEGGLGIPCLNHACDAGTNTVSDLFGESDAKDRDTGAR